MQRIRWIEHNGAKIIFGDYKGLNTDEAISQVKDSYGKMLAEPDPMLVLADFSGVRMDKTFMAFAKSEESKRVVPKMKKFAVVGLTSVQKIILNSYNIVNNAEAKAFDSKEQALEWLVPPKKKKSFWFFGQSD